MQNAARGWLAGQRLPDPLVRTVEEGACAYASFRSVLEAEMGPPVGVKVGFTSREVQRRFGVDGPLTGALFAPMLVPDGSRLSLAGSRAPMFEADLVVTVEDGAIMQARTREEVVRALRDVRPFIEIPDLALRKDVQLSGPLMVAYGAAPWRGVLGRGIAIADLADPVADLATLTVELRRNGQAVTTGRGDMLLGHPLDVVLWLVQNSPYQLKPGSVISLGSFGAPQPAVAGQRIEALYRIGGHGMKATVTLVP
ncbi:MULTISPECIES: 2-keto-4-pentenoate hydratase [unclassified Paracoccus (in: a-proteobacteria)]|uniref:2-keto-4-pentenoate hydratase n=1 Tax=unclassified Paracoccus (in: a-proteobacteria) TaxID=2688777 RepID=UPI001E54BA7D|nr:MULTISPECIES: hydratase [unclassified Paracoccus (in: a-proteobacteria)]UXU76174.1 hydratase [Paracoccus sp. SMMA_5]UXU82078.1 hydratase [Paracoccus sp. SMMA_5_TC]